MFESKRIGFIGAGMMAESIARGLLKCGVDPNRIAAYDPSKGRLDVFREELGVVCAESNKSVAEFADILILAIKPFVVSDALSGIGDVMHPEQLIVSIAAGITTVNIESKLTFNVPVVRVMPNTPCLIGEGATAIAAGKYATHLHLDIAGAIFGAVGKVVHVSEDKIDAVTGLSGSGPAYVYMFIEALADGGVRMGLPRATAQLLAAQTLVGAAKMVLEGGENPAVLRDRVTTPGGTTVAGTSSLEASGFRSAAIEAVTAATIRSAELGKTK